MLLILTEMKQMHDISLGKAVLVFCRKQVDTRMFTGGLSAVIPRHSDPN